VSGGRGYTVREYLTSGRAPKHEHEDAGRALDELRRLTGGYQPPTGACTTFRGLYHGLAELEADLHRHILLENNVLFPRATALEATAVAPLGRTA
jgi:regulator of cell morphogenesis and NO signaling